MINENFLILGFAAEILGMLKYLLETIKGKVKPNRVSFFLWALAPLVAFAAQIKQGVGIQSLLTFSVGFSPLVILIATFFNKKSAWKLGLFDFVCGFLSLAGLLLWYITRIGNIAIIFAIIADALAALPTIRKAYYYPATEYSGAYFASIIFATITLLVITVWNFAHYGWPIYTLLINGIIFVLVQFKIGAKSA
ncbi:hypothetical protein M1437_02760 [Patescibacteria group bacterium]|nr:hypothetical protein [Patescibacteria group bacterium]